MTERQQLGTFGERVAIAHLEEKGYRIRETNFRLRELGINRCPGMLPKQRVASSNLVSRWHAPGRMHMEVIKRSLPTRRSRSSPAPRPRGRIDSESRSLYFASARCLM